MFYALVTGGTRGIGMAYTKALLARGYRVVFTGTSQASVDAATSQYGLAETFGQVLDATNADAALAVFKDICTKFSPRIVILNASLEHVENDIEERDAARLMSVNVTFNALASRYLITRWRDCTIPHTLIGASSVATVIDLGPEYTASRHFQSVFWRRLAEAYNSPRIHVALVETPVVLTTTLLQSLVPIRGSSTERNVLKIAYDPDEFVHRVLRDVLERRRTFVCPGWTFHLLRKLGIRHLG